MLQAPILDLDCKITLGARSIPFCLVLQDLHVSAVPWNDKTHKKKNKNFVSHLCPTRPETVRFILGALTHEHHVSEPGRAVSHVSHTKSNKRYLPIKKSVSTESIQKLWPRVCLLLYASMPSIHTSTCGLLFPSWWLPGAWFIQRNCCLGRDSQAEAEEFQKGGRSPRQPMLNLFPPFTLNADPHHSPLPHSRRVKQPWEGAQCSATCPSLA